MARTQFPEEYRQLLRRYNELRVAGRLGLTQENRDEMVLVAAQMEAYELALVARSTIALAADDYDEAMLLNAGNLGTWEP